VKITHREHYALQMQNHKIEPGVNEGCVGVPVAAILEKGERAWNHDRFFSAAQNVMKASVKEWHDGGKMCAVIMKYPNRSPEIWADAHYGGYRSLYEKFCSDILKQRLHGRYLLTGFDVDHAYCKAAVPMGISGFIRLFLVPRSSNRSWGGYFERKLKDSFADEIRVGIRSETVAIRAKVSGIKAPKLGRVWKKDNKTIPFVVDQLLARGMVEPSTRYSDIASLTAFCNIVDGRARGISSRQFVDANGEVRVETKNSEWL